MYAVEALPEIVQQLETMPRLAVYLVLTDERRVIVLSMAWID